MKLRRETDADLLEFASWTELVRQALTSGDLPDARRASRDRSKDEWAGASWDEAVTLAHTGWADGARRARDLVRQFWDAVRPSVAPRDEWPSDVVGDSLDIGAYVSGLPDCWHRFVTAPVPIRRLHLIVNAAASHTVSAEELIAKGAAVTAAAEAVVLGGGYVRVDVLWCMQARGSARRMSTWCPLIDYGQRALLTLVAYVLAHPSSLRRILFSVWENLPVELRRLYGYESDGPYGYPKDLASPPTGAVYVPAGALPDPVAWVRRAISGQQGKD